MGDLLAGLDLGDATAVRRRAAEVARDVAILRAVGLVQAGARSLTELGIETPIAKAARRLRDQHELRERREMRVEQGGEPADVGFLVRAARRLRDHEAGLGSRAFTRRR